MFSMALHCIIVYIIIAAYQIDNRDRFDRFEMRCLQVIHPVWIEMID